MSLTCGFFNSLNKDRKYNSTHFSKLFDGVIKDGIFMSIGEALSVTATDSMSLRIGTGRAWFNRTWTENDSAMLVTVDMPEIILDRIDAVVLEVNEALSVRTNTIKMIKGVPSSAPVKPKMANREDVHQYPLCYVTVDHGITTLTNAELENARGTSACPFVTGILETITIDTLVAQWGSEWRQWLNETMADTDVWTAQQKAEFDAWFDDINSKMGTAPATALQQQINKIEDGTTSVGNAMMLSGLSVNDLMRGELIVEGTDLLDWALVQSSSGSFTAERTVLTGVPRVSRWSGSMVVSPNGGDPVLQITDRVDPFSTYTNVFENGEWGGWVSAGDSGNAATVGGLTNKSFVRTDDKSSIMVGTNLGGSEKSDVPFDIWAAANMFYRLHAAGGNLSIDQFISDVFSKNAIKIIDGLCNINGTSGNSGMVSSAGVGTYCASVTDWNTATKCGFYMNSAAANSPAAGRWFFGQVIGHNTNWVKQIVWDFTGDGGRYERTCSDPGTQTQAWSAWARKDTQTVTVSVTTAWSGSGPWTQNIAIPGVLATDSPIIDVHIAPQHIEAIESVYNCIDIVEAYNGGITLSCIKENPPRPGPINISVKVVR